MIILSPEMNFQKENDEVFDADFFPAADFREDFLDAPPFCESANFLMLDVFDLFATSINNGYRLWVIRLLKTENPEWKFQRTKIQYLI